MTETIAAYDITPPVPVPSTAVTDVPAAQVSTQIPTAAEAAARANQAMAQETDRFGLHLDTLSAQDALNKLRAQREDLTYGPQGLMKIKGGDVQNKLPDGTTLLDGFSTQFQNASDDLAKNLSGRARIMYNEKAAQEATAFKTDIAKHSIEQLEHYDVAVLKDGLSQDTTAAARYFNDPAELDKIAARTADRARNAAVKHGMPGDAAALAAQSNVYTIAVKSLIAAGAQRQALGYFNANQNKFDAGDRVQLAAAMKTISTGVDAENVANAAADANGLPRVRTDDTSAPDAYVSRSSGTTPNNIGNVRPPGASTGFQQPASFDEGVALAVRNARAYPQAFNRGQPMTLLQIGAHWAPKGDGANDPAQWARNVSAGSGLPVDQPIDLNNSEIAAKFARGVHGAEWGANYVKPVADYLTGAQNAGTAATVTPPKAQAPTPFDQPDTVAPTGMAMPTAKGDLKARYSKGIIDIAQNPNLSLTVRTQAMAMLSGEATRFEALQAASVKSLTDNADATTALAFASPSTMAPGTFGQIADQYAALGQQSMALRYRMLASMEGSLKQGLEGMDSTKAQILESILPPGLGKEIVQGYLKNAGKVMGEEHALGTEVFGRVQKAITEEGVLASGLTATAKEAIDHFARAGKSEDVRKVADFMQSAVDAQGITTGQSRTAAEAMLKELGEHANKGELTAQQLQMYGLASTMFNKQKELIKQDPLANGATVYAKTVGPLATINPVDPENEGLVLRSQQARQLAAMTGVPTPPLTNVEIQALRANLENAPPAQQAATYKALSRQLPPDQFMLVAEKLSGKAGGDAVSRSHAAAMMLYADNDPVRDQVADKILKGAAIRKAGEAGGRKIAENADTWLQAWQDETSTALKDIDDRMKQTINDAVGSVYVADMHAAGRQAEKVDDSVMRQAIKQVVGSVITMGNGQPLIPPMPGMTRYDTERAIGLLRPTDIPGDLRTGEGDQITADQIKSKGVFSNVGDGIYMVRIADPRRGGVPSEIPLPHGMKNKLGGNALLIDLRDLMGRGGMQSGSQPDPYPLTGASP